MEIPPPQVSQAQEPNGPRDSPRGARRPSRTSADVSAEVLVEQLRLLFTLGPRTLAASQGTVLVAVAVFWSVTETTLFLGWVAAVSLVNGLRALLVRAYWRNEGAGGVPWQGLYLTGALVSGALWGSLALFMQPDWPPLQQVAPYLFLAGLSAGAIPANAVLYPVYVAFLVPVVVPILSLHALRGGPDNLALSGLIAIYLVLVLVTARQYSRTLAESLRLRLENRDLLSNLTAANDELQAEVRERRRAQEALVRERDLARVTLHSIADGVITTDGATQVAFLNPVAEQITGWSQTEARGQPLGEVFPVQDDTDPEGGPGERSGRYAEIAHRETAQVYAVNYSIAPIRDGNSRPAGSVVVFHDVSEMRAMERELAFQASHDPLTGLSNRREFERRLEQALETARREGRQHVCLYLDLDRFKRVNDTCGHVAGDDLLRQLATELARPLRGADILARLGGDEFGVLLEGCPVDKGLQIAESLRAVVKEFRFVWEEKEFEIGVSIGAVPVTGAEPGVDGLLIHADAACYAAKDLGRDRVQLFQEDGPSPRARPAGATG